MCLFGFIMSAPLLAFADSSSNFQACKDMKWKDGKKANKNCFSDLAAGLMQEIEKLTPTSVLWVDRDSIGDFNRADGIPPEYEVLDAPFDSVKVLFLTGPDARDPIVVINSLY